MLGNKFDSEILVSWPISKRFYENAVGQTFKTCWFAVLLPAQSPPPPPNKIAIQWVFFFFPKPWQALIAFHQKLYFQWYRHWCIDFHLKYSSFMDSILDPVLSIVKEVLKYDQV